MSDIPGHPQLVIWKHPKLLCGGNIDHATFYVKQHRGSLGVYVIILKYRPVSVTETILQLLEASSGHTCMTLAVGLSVLMRGL